MAIKTKRFLAAKGTISCSMPGAYRAVASMEGVVVVFHSPKACTHVTRTMDINSFYRGLAKKEYYQRQATIPLVSTLLSEKNSIFGGSEQLEKCLDYVAEHFMPKCIIVANSCVAGVIGDDVESITKDKEKEHNIPILLMPYSGFLDGEYYDGYCYCAETLIDRFVCGPCKKDENSVVLIGDQGGPNGHYALEIKRLIQYFDLYVTFQFPTYTSFVDLPKLATSSLNILLCSHGTSQKGLRKIAKKLKDKCETPFYGSEDYPSGWENIKKWILELGEILGKSDLAKAALLSEQKYLEENLSEYNKDFSKITITVCIGRELDHFNPTWLFDMLSLTKININGIVLLDSYTIAEKEKMLKKLKEITTLPILEQEAGSHLIEEADIIITTHELQEDNLRQMFIPMLPVVGVTGIIAFLDAIKMLYYRHGEKRGTIYA